jgi:hypothetical protein
MPCLAVTHKAHLPLYWLLLLWLLLLLLLLLL